MYLTGKRIVVTRDAVQAGPFIEELQNSGAEAVSFPAILIADIDRPENAIQILKKGSSYDWLVFTSINAVKYFFKLAGQCGFKFDNIQIACVGKKTEEKLAEYNISSNLTPDTYTAKQLLESFKKFDVNKKSILLPVSNIARVELENGLKELGALITRMEVYKTVPNYNLDKSGLLNQIREKKIDCITFFSPSAVNYFVKLMGIEIISLIKNKKTAVAAIGPATAEAVSQNNLTAAVVPEKSDYKKMVQALERYFQEK